MAVLLRAREAAVPPAAGASVAEVRSFWSRYTAATHCPPPAGMDVSDVAVAGPGEDVPVRLYRPAGAEPTPGVILYMHGGGFVLGGLDSSDSVAWGLAEKTGAVVASVDYRLAPEHPFPAPLNDCLAALRWLADSPAEAGIDPARIAVAGDSAGGNLAAALTIAARDAGGPAICAQTLLYPCTGIDLALASYTDYAEGPGLTTASMVWFRDAYTPDATGLADPLAWPAVAQDFSRLPPAFVHSAEIDPIRDEGRVYASRLACAGVDVTYREAKGMIHGFARAHVTGAAARTEFDALCEFLSRQLAG
jgi:acetyl esterase